MGASSDAKPGWHESRRAQAEAAILTAAREIIGERGVDGAHLSAIAKRAGVARGAIAYYFNSKDELLARAWAGALDGWMERVAQRLRPTRSLEDFVDALGKLTRDVIDNPAAHILLREADRLALRDSGLRELRQKYVRRWHEELAAILDEKAAEGIIGLPTDAHLLGALLTAIVAAVGTEAELGGDSRQGGEWELGATDAELRRLVAMILAPEAKAASRVATGDRASWRVPNLRDPERDQQAAPSERHRRVARDRAGRRRFESP